jgi:excisionase family DNA binding protein
MGEARSPMQVDLSSRLALRQDEAASVLGISVRTLRNLQPEIPHIRRGGVILIPVAGLEAWLAQQATTATIASADADDVLSKLNCRIP